MTGVVYLNEAALQWLAALRSGDYVKGKGYLERKGCHCALGVAQKLFGTTESKPEVPYDAAPTVFYDAEADAWVGNALTSEVQKRVGLVNRTGGLVSLAHVENYNEASIWRMNDFVCTTLPEVADWIEANASNLFHPVVTFTSTRSATA